MRGLLHEAYLYRAKYKRRQGDVMKTVQLLAIITKLLFI